MTADLEVANAVSTARCYLCNLVGHIANVAGLKMKIRGSPDDEAKGNLLRLNPLSVVVVILVVADNFTTDHTRVVVRCKIGLHLEGLQRIVILCEDWDVSVG